MMDMAELFKGMKRLELFTQGNEQKWEVGYKIHVILSSPTADVRAKTSKKIICFSYQ